MGGGASEQMHQRGEMNTHPCELTDESFAHAVMPVALQPRFTHDHK